MANNQARENNNNEEVQEAINSLEDFFEVEHGTNFGGANQLQKTAQLTNMAEKLVGQILQVMSANPPLYDAQLQASSKDHDAMDDLINSIVNIPQEDLTFLENTDPEEIEKMIRSQQSKRSRSKSKQMTLANYKTMMVGAVAENLLRVASGKHKSVGGGAVMGEIGFSSEDLEELAKDPEELKKAIRNVQSKKSIMKHKHGFDPQSTRWLLLETKEQQLKDIRDRGSAATTQRANEILQTQKATEELLANVDTENMTADEAKQMLDSIKEMLASK